MRHLEELGFVLPDPGAATTLTRLDARPGTDLVAMAQAVGMDWAEFSALNPAYKRIVSPMDRSSPLYVPEHAMDEALACLGDACARRAGGWTTYTVVKNDNWQRISAKSGVPVDVLKKVNGNRALKAGASLRIPGGVSPAAVQIARATPASVKKREEARTAAARKGAPKTAAKTAKPASGPKGASVAGTYRVQPGDTMWSIARKHNMPLQALIRINNMRNPAMLRPGDTIRVTRN